MYHDDEATEFEMNPLGARQRMLPSRTFVARNARAPVRLQAPPMAEAAATPVSLAEPAKRPRPSFAPAAFLATEAAQPARLSPPIVPTARPTAMPAVAMPVLLLPPEIHYPDELISSSIAALPAASSSIGLAAALPVASRRFRWIAAPLVSLLALVLLGGALWQPHEVQGPSIAPGIASTDEDIAPGDDFATASEDPAPAEEEAPAPVAKPAAKNARPVVATSTAKRVVAKQRKVTVNTSSALGNLRPKKAW
jgi:ribonuclease E